MIYNNIIYITHYLKLYNLNIYKYIQITGQFNTLYLYFYVYTEIIYK